jgi:hypothetical protein
MVMLRKRLEDEEHGVPRHHRQETDESGARRRSDGGRGGRVEELRYNGRAGDEEEGASAIAHREAERRCRKETQQQ